MFNYLLCSIKRKKTANLITVGISIMLVLLLHLYFGCIRSYTRQLTELSQTVPVQCQVINRSGSLGNGLFIPERILENLEHSDQVADLSYKVVLMAGEGDFREAEYTKYLNLFVMGANKVGAVGDLMPDMITMERENTDELLASDRMECIVSENVMEKRGWKMGESILLKFYYYSADSEFNKLQLYSMGGTVEIKIAGSMEAIKGQTNAISPDIILPFDTVRNIYGQFGYPFFADTVTFQVKNPLHLNEFKEEMKDIGFLETEPKAEDSYTGNTLSVRDSSFMAGATDLRHSIELMRSLFPVVCVLVLLIGYVVSYLSGNSRKEEYALFRLQGVKKGRGVMLFLLEQMILVFIGNLVGDVFIAPAVPGLLVMLAVNGVLLGAYLVGAAAAYGRMSRGSVVYLLSAQQ